jgi:hypothetical protein
MKSGEFKGKGDDLNRRNVQKGAVGALKDCRVYHSIYTLHSGFYRRFFLSVELGITNNCQPTIDDECGLGPWGNSYPPSTLVILDLPGGCNSRQKARQLCPLPSPPAQVAFNVVRCVSIRAQMHYLQADLGSLLRSGTYLSDLLPNKQSASLLDCRKLCEEELGTTCTSFIASPAVC